MNSENAREMHGVDADGLSDSRDRKRVGKMRVD
jgi:hypothetical protein